MKKIIIIILMIVFGFLGIAGLLFQIMHWPGSFLLKMIASVGLVIGIVVFLVFNKKLK